MSSIPFTAGVGIVGSVVMPMEIEKKIEKVNDAVKVVRYELAKQLNPWTLS